MEDESAGALRKWWTWFYREVLCWTHPDTGLDLVLDGYGNWLKALARGPELPGDSACATGYYKDVGRAQLYAAINEAMTRGTDGLSQLMSIESQLVGMYCESRLERRQWSFQERFRRVAAGNAAIAYLASAPPAPGDHTDDKPDPVKADAEAAKQAAVPDGEGQPAAPIDAGGEIKK